MSRDAEILVGVDPRRDPATEVRLPVRRLHRPGVIIGGTGLGKTTLVVAIVAQLLTRAPQMRLVILDAKGELVELMTTVVLPALSTRYPHIHPERVLTVQPYGPHRVGLDPLVRIPAVDPMHQAWTVVTALGEVCELGERMRNIAFSVVAAVSLAGGNLLDVVSCLSSEDYCRRLAGRVPDPELVQYLREILHKWEPSTSIASLRSRLDALLRIADMRTLLCSGNSVSGADLLAYPLTMVSTAGVPLADVRQTRLIQSLVFARLVGGIFSRPRAETKTPVLILVDEAAEWLRAEGGENFERVLAMARSQGCAIWLIVQTLKQLSDVSPLLVQSVLTNSDIDIRFRPDPAEVRHLDALLPLSGGRRPDPERPDRLLSEAQERALLRGQLSRMPERTVLFSDRRAGEAHILRTPSVNLDELAARAQEVSPEIREAFLRGARGIPRAEAHAWPPLFPLEGVVGGGAQGGHDADDLETEGTDQGNPSGRRRGRGRPQLKLVLPGGGPT